MAANARWALKSAFAADLGGYIAYKRDALNYKATAAERFHAPSFDRFCFESFPDKDVLDMGLALAWVGGTDSAGEAAERASFMREFARYLVLEGKDACILPGKVTPASKLVPVPRVFTDAELGAFFDAADALPPHPLAGCRHIMAPVLFRLMYCAGLRPHEARTLAVRDFDLESGVIAINDSKGRDRDVPVKRDVAEMCREYDGLMAAILPGRQAFFPNRDGSGPWSWYSMKVAFRLCCERAGIERVAGARLVPYSFRHTFATNCIRRWRDEGADLPESITLLQAYLGHGRVERTLYYVHMVPGGPGDPAPFSTWEPTDRMREGAADGNVQGA